MSQSGIEFTDPIVPAEALQQNNYVSVAIAAAVMYDYVLIFPQEVEYIWNKPWSFVSSLFVLVRYLGCCCALVSPFYTGTTLLSSKHALGCALFTLTQFAFIIFLAAADMVMILRVWAMYHQSKFILCILLTIYIPEFVLTTVVAVIASTPKNTVVITVLNRSSCVTGLPLYRCIEDALIFILPAGVTCMLAIIQFARELLQTHRYTKQWKLNPFMRILFRESILYFIVILIFGVVDVHNHSVFLEGQTWFSFLSAVSCVPVFALTPRFILSLRSLYAHDLQGRIDTAFGLLSVIAFADVERDEEAQGGEEKQVEYEEYAWSADDLY